MINLRLLCLTACMVSTCFAFSGEQETFNYRKELETLKHSDEFRDLINNEDMNCSLQEIRRDIENYKEISIFRRINLYPFWSFEVLAVTPKSMPTLYKYVESVSKKAGIKTPTVFLSNIKNLFNAFALKLFMDSGAILIGEKLLDEVSDAELEAVVAHEIGHIVHNHVNKTLAINMASIYAALKILNYNQQDRSTQLYINGAQFESPSLSSVYFLGSLISALAINKRFEKQADEFACKTMKKGEGVIQFFERLLVREKAYEKHFGQTYDVIERNAPEIGLIDRTYLKTRYYLTSGVHKVGKALAWVYHNTPLGAHPSHEARIEAAKKYLAEHPEAA